MKISPFKALRLTLINVLLWQNAIATLWVEDGITGTVGSNLGAAAPYSGGNARIIIPSGNLTYSGLTNPVPAGNQFIITGATSSGKSYRTNTATAITSGSVYYAFLVQCTNQPGATADYLTSLLATPLISGSTDPLAVYTKSSGTGFVFGIRKNAVSAASFATAHSIEPEYNVSHRCEIHLQHRIRH